MCLIFVLICVLVLMSTVYFLVSIILPLLIMGVCYSCIAVSLRKSANFTKNPQQKKDNKMRSAEIRIIQSTVILSVIYLFCYTYCAVVQYGNMFFRVPIYPHYHIAQALVLLNSCINPFVYCLRYDDFQNRFKQIILCCPIKLSNFISMRIERRSM